MNAKLRSYNQMRLLYSGEVKIEGEVCKVATMLGTMLHNDMSLMPERSARTVITRLLARSLTYHIAFDLYAVLMATLSSYRNASAWQCLRLYSVGEAADAPRQTFSGAIEVSAEAGATPHHGRGH